MGGEAAWGPGVALELPSLPGAVPSPRQAPSHTPTPPTPPGPEARRVGVWICWDAARGSCAPSPEAVQSGCVQGPWRVSAQVSERALDLCAPPAVLGRRLLPGGPGFAPVCWPEGGEVCVAPTGRFVMRRLVPAGSALQPGERDIHCLGLSVPASETVFHKCSASRKRRGPRGLCSGPRSWWAALREHGGRSPGKEAGVGGTGAGGPAPVSALRQARSLALPSASLRLWPGHHRCFSATTDSACGAPGGGGWGGRPGGGGLELLKGPPLGKTPAESQSRVRGGGALMRSD